jgi:hypothetical protein
VLISFGGLLMRLSGQPEDFDRLRLDAKLYLLVRKN